ncbi:hypothetical protein N7445_000985, partial [Penicillium cf. griseofulvum]
ADLLLKIPDSLSFEEAATLGVGTGTAALGLFHELRIPASLEQLTNTKGDAPKGEFVLITGGSTATGTHAISSEIIYIWRTQQNYATRPLGGGGGRYVSLEPVRAAITQTRPTVEPSWLMVLSLFGHQVALDGDYGRPARPEYRKFGREAFTAVQALLDRGLVDTHPIKIMAGGWDGVIKGVALIRSQAPSGSKLVYSV